MKDDFQFFYRFLLWRDKHIKEKHFILIVSFLVGLCTAAAAIILKTIIHFIQHLLTGNFNLDGANYLYLLYPVIGILLAGLFVKYVVRDDISHGVTKILYAISQRKSRIKPHNTWTSIVASSVTIGFGGSVGAEAPIVLTGAAIGSNLGRLFRMEQKTLMLLVGCGAAGAIAGIFKAPIAGVVFVVEVLLLDLTMTSVLPFAYHFGDGCDRFLYLYGYGGDVPVLADRSVCDRAYSIRAAAWRLLRFGVSLFYQGHEPGRGYVPEFE